MGRIGIGDLELVVVNLGHSTRRAKRVIETVLNFWKRALAGGAAVEAPGGIIRVRTVTDRRGFRIVRLRKGSAAGLKPVIRRPSGKHRVIKFLHTFELVQVVPDGPYEPYSVPRRANGLIDRRSEWRREQRLKERIERRHRYLFGPD